MAADPRCWLNGWTWSGEVGTPPDGHSSSNFGLFFLAVLACSSRRFLHTSWPILRVHRRTQVAEAMKQLLTRPNARNR